MEAATTAAGGDGGGGGGGAVAAAASSSTTTTTTTTTSSSSKKEVGFGGWLQRVRRTGEFSDVLVRINGTTSFHLHMLPLRNASAFFRDELTDHSSSSTSDKQVVEIRELPGGPEAFSVAADFCYLIKPVLTFESVGGVRAAAEKLGMPDLVDTTKRFLYASVFSHWRSSVAFLERFRRLGSSAPSVDEYIESRCLKVVMAACTKAFAETKHVSVPIVPPKCQVGASPAMVEASTKCPVGASAAMRASKGAAGSSSICWQSSPCHSLTDVLVTVSSRLPDQYMAQLVETLVEVDVNLSIKCRQGRNVRAWLNHLLRDECATDRARCWILVCLATMLLKSAAPPIAGERSWMELSSQYWCSLLEHVGQHVGFLMSSNDEDKQQSSMLERLLPIKASLEQRIGASLHELDDYLQSYRFSPETLLSLVRHFVREPKPQQQEEEDEGYDEQQQLEEVAAEVDGCLWAFAEIPGSITAHEFVSIFSAFPASCRPSHDTLYASIERMLAKDSQQQQQQQQGMQRMFGVEEIQALWGLVDCDKLSAAVHEQALNNPSFLCQPHVLERVLRRHNEELATMGEHGEDRQNLRHIMQKVIKASLKLLEENNRRSKEIVELQKQYLALLGGGGGGGAAGGGGKGCFVYRDSSSCDNSPDVFEKPISSLQNLSFKGASARGLVHPDESAKGSSPEDEDGMVVAPQTPMPEARRSLHSMNLGEVLAS